MKLIELTPTSANMGGVQKVISPIKRLFPLGKKDEHAEADMIARFARTLDNRFVMLHKLPMEGTDEVFPPILVGPSGVVLLNVNPTTGFFKAKEESWWEMSKSTHRFKPARPNLIKQSLEYAQKLAEFLDNHEKSHPEIVPVLIFSNPGVDLETTNPAIRIVRMDGVDSLIGSIVNSEEVLSINEIDFLADSLEILVNPEKAIPMGEGEDFFGRDLLIPEEKSPSKLPKVKLPTNFSLPPVEEKFKFTPRQWLILEVLMILTIVVLVGGIIYVLIIY